MLLLTSFQRIPQHIEAPPYIEAKLIISYIPIVPLYHSNYLLLKDGFKLLIFFDCWQAPCYCYLYDVGHYTRVLTEKRMELSQTFASLSGSVPMKKGCQSNR